MKILILQLNLARISCRCLFTSPITRWSQARLLITQACKFQSSKHINKMNYCWRAWKCEVLNCFGRVGLWFGCVPNARCDTPNHRHSGKTTTYELQTKGINADWYKMHPIVTNTSKLTNFYLLWSLWWQFLHASVHVTNHRLVTPCSQISHKFVQFNWHRR